MITPSPIFFGSRERLLPYYQPVPHLRTCSLVENPSPIFLRKQRGVTTVLPASTTSTQVHSWKILRQFFSKTERGYYSTTRQYNIYASSLVEHPSPIFFINSARLLPTTLPTSARYSETRRFLRLQPILSEVERGSCSSTF